MSGTSEGWTMLWKLMISFLCLTTGASSLIAQGLKVFDGPAEEILKEGAGEGPAWHPKTGLVFSGHGHIQRLTDQKQIEVYRKDAGSNGLLFDTKGRLLICSPKNRQVARLEGEKWEVLTERYEGKRYNQPNDITVDSKGRIFFSDPKYGDRVGMELLDEKGKPVEGVYRIDPSGEVVRVITHEVDRPNGVLVSMDGRFLYVADNNNNTVGGARKLWRFELKENGDVDLKSQKLLYDWKTGRGPDGMAEDFSGRLYVAGGRNKAVPKFETAEEFKGGVYVFSAEGERLDFLEIPNDEVTNCAFGGADMKTLYITAGGHLWSVRTKARGYSPVVDGKKIRVSVSGNLG
ncbi:MAG: SMP-30/gluconolactonase/LRE family protein, partial [Verrucomicrobiota bacterium]